MKYILTICCAFLLAGLIASAEAGQGKEKQGKLRHVVVFKFKESASPEDVQKVEKAFRDLKKQIKQIQAYEWGTNVSKENLNKGFTHCFFLTFKNDEDRDIYIEHPAHKEFVKLLGPYLEEAFVIDYYASK